MKYFRKISYQILQASSLKSPNLIDAEKTSKESENPVFVWKELTCIDKVGNVYL